MNWLKRVIKNMVAGKELNELWFLKQRLHDLEHWCSYDPAISAAARWAQAPHERTKVGNEFCPDIELMRRHLKRHYTPSTIINKENNNEQCK